VRNGITESALFATITTDASCGAVNGMHEALRRSAVWFRWPTSCWASGVRRCGLGAIRDADLCGAGGVYAGLMVDAHRSTWQEDRVIRREDVDALCAHLSTDYSFACGSVVISPNIGLSSLNNAGRTDCPKFFTRLLQPREQRLGLCGTEREHVVVQRALDRHAGRAFLMRSCAGIGRQPGAEEERSAIAGTFPGTTRYLRRC